MRESNRSRSKSPSFLEATKIPVLKQNQQSDHPVPIKHLHSPFSKKLSFKSIKCHTPNNVRDISHREIRLSSLSNSKNDNSHD